jgi:replicative DNA helicase
LVKQYKEPAEANIVGSLYLNSDLFLECKLTQDDFTFNHWRVYFIIANDLFKEKKSLTEDNIEFYLNQHPQLAEQYKNSKGYQTLDTLKSTVKEEDFDGYIAEMGKWNAVLKIASKGFPIKDQLSEFADYSAEKIYDTYTGYLNDAFMNIEEKVKSYNVLDGIHEFNERCDAGQEQGLPFCAYDKEAAQILNQEVNGFNVNGHIYALGGLSGTGKSTLAINLLFPTILVTGERAVFIINEEDQDKFRREAETWVINNIILKHQEGKYFNKKRFREGHFTDEEKEWLRQAADFLEARKEEHLITVVPLERYTVSVAIKIIKKYAKLFGVRIFCIDTFKESADIRQDESTWKSMERDARALYDVIKASALNVGLFLTYQLSKASSKTRYLTKSDIGQAKNIEDVFSVNLMVRRVYPDEMLGEKKEIKYWVRLQGGSKIERHMERDKSYLIMFICKNRFGSSDPYQILIECDLGTNKYKELGTCYVTQDF